MRELSLSSMGCVFTKEKILVDSASFTQEPVFTCGYQALSWR